MTILWGFNGTETFVREPGRTAGPSAPPDFLSKIVASVDFMRLSTESRIRCRWKSREVGNPGALGMTKLGVVTLIRGRLIGWTEKKQQVPFDFALPILTQTLKPQNGRPFYPREMRRSA